MLRKARLIAPFVRSLLFGAVIVPGFLLTGASLVGCEDEEDPNTHIERMKDPQKRKDPLLNRPAIKRLIQAYSDADSADKKDPNKPTVKALLDKIMEPLAQVCLEESVKDQDRSKLVKFMADTRDKRAEPCLKKTLEEYKPDTNEDDVTNVLLSITATEMKSLLPEVMKVYKTMEFSRMKAKPLGAHVIKALKTLGDKSLEDEFLKMIEPPIEGNDPSAVNQGFWQKTAAFMLGEIKSEKAAKPLLKMILTPTKGPLAQFALVSLVKIGKASIAPAEALLKGEDKELLDYSEQEQLKGAEKAQDGKVPKAAQEAAKKAYLPMAAEVLGNLGSEASAAPLLSALEKASDEKTGDPTTRVIVALALTMLPKSTATIEAYKKTYEETKLDLEIPAGPAKELLASRATDFFDLNMTPWLVKATTDLKAPAGSDPNAEIDPVRQVAFITGLKLMTKDQVGDVEGLGNLEMVTLVMDEKTKKEEKKKVKVSKGYARANTPCEEAPKDEPKGEKIDCTKPLQFDQAKALLDACKDDVKCYIAAATSDENQKKEKEFTAIKAMYMVGILGKDEHRDQLVDALPKIDNKAVRATGLKVIEAMTPKNGAGPADKLEAHYTKVEDLKDTEKMQEFQIFLQSAARLRARSQ